MTKHTQNYINHVALVLDSSYSMYRLVADVVRVTDDLIAHLAQRSKEMDQETRVTVYTFNDTAECVVFDKDVLRLPSIKQFYRASGNTALIDATLLSIDDLRMTMQKYGDHAFLTYVLTDGFENASRHNANNLVQRLRSLDDNETLAVLVPNEAGRVYANQYGFPQDNVAIWETTAAGLEDAATRITRSVDTYMDNRKSGQRSTKSLFSTSTDVVNKKTVNAKDLEPLDRDKYVLLSVDKEFPIREWVREKGYEYSLGSAFYQLTKTETIQPQKFIAIQNIHSGRIYTGPEARTTLGLPNESVRVKPTGNPEYRIFVQSTSVNRRLVPGTKLLLLR